jgi:hypothetical protein
LHCRLFAQALIAAVGSSRKRSSLEPIHRCARRNDVTNVYLTPGGGTDAAALCEQAADELLGHLHAVAALAAGVHDGWLGSCAEGRAWAALLQEKAVGPNSLCRLLEQHVTNLATIAERFRATAGGYGEVDHHHAERRWPGE